MPLKHYECSLTLDYLEGHTAGSAARRNPKHPQHLVGTTSVHDIHQIHTAFGLGGMYPSLESSTTAVGWEI